MTVSGQTTQFIYDGDGNLVKKIKPDNSKTLYPSTGLRAGVGGVYEGLDRVSINSTWQLDPTVDKTSGGSVTRTVTYYLAGGAMLLPDKRFDFLQDKL